MKKGTFAWLAAVLAFPAWAQNGYRLMRLGSESNPPTQQGVVWNAENDNETESTGWVKILADSLGQQSYSAAQTLPFGFSFAGNAMSQYWVSGTGYLTFQEPKAAPLEPSDAFLPMPISGLPDASVYVGGVRLDGDNDGVYTKVFGQAPNRQLWVRFHSATTTLNRYAYYSIVLEEGSNRIHVVEQMADLSNSLRAMSTGIQVDSQQVYQLWETLSAHYDAMRVPSDNQYATFEWGQALENDWQLEAYQSKQTKIIDYGNAPPFGGKLPINLQVRPLAYQTGADVLVNTYFNGVWVDTSTISIPAQMEEYLGYSYPFWLRPEIPTSAWEYGKAYDVMHILQVDGDGNAGNDTVRQRLLVRNPKTGASDTSELYIESFTASWCTECPAAQDFWMDSLVRSHDGPIVWVQHHSYDGIQPSLSPMLQRYDRQPISTFYPVDFPAAFLNRTPTFGPGFVVPPSQWAEAAVQLSYKGGEKTVDVQVLNLVYDTLSRMLSGELTVTARNYCWADEIHIGGSLLETSVRGLGFGFDQSVKTAWTLDSQSLYFGKQNPMVGYAHKRAAIGYLFGGEEPAISSVHELLSPGDSRKTSFSLKVPFSPTEVEIPEGADFEPFGKSLGRGKLADLRVVAFAWEELQQGWSTEGFAPIVAVNEAPLWNYALKTNPTWVSSNLQLYPNPSVDHLTVNCPGKGALHWQVLDGMGRIHMQGTSASEQAFQISSSSLQAGTYWLRCVDERGQSWSQAWVKLSR